MLSHCLDRDSPRSLTRVTRSPEVTSHRPGVLPWIHQPQGKPRAHPSQLIILRTGAIRHGEGNVLSDYSRGDAETFLKMRHKTRKQGFQTLSPSNFLPKAAGF